MSKFSIFTLFLASVIVVVIAELLVNNYVKDPYGQKVLQANLMNAQAETQQSVKQSPNQAASTVLPSSQESSQAVLNDTADAGKKYNSVSFEAIKLAGAGDYEVLQPVPFNGILFESIDLRDLKSVPVVQQNLMRNNREKLAIIYEFEANDGALATEIYQYLREKAHALIGATVNENNKLGVSSFYINFLSQPDNAFLVVKQTENVYALAYRKDIHAFIRQLISLLI